MRPVHQSILARCQHRKLYGYIDRINIQWLADTPNKMYSIAITVTVIGFGLILSSQEINGPLVVCGH